MYVHHAFKRARYGANPIDALAALARNPPLAEADFNRTMLNIFLELHDPHTNYALPEPYQSATAFLPFQAALCHDDARGRRYVVTHVASEFTCPGFGPGAEITHWNGLPIDMAVQQLAFRENGANPTACTARAIFNLTVRPLRRLPPPDAPAVTLRYVADDGSGEVCELMVDWSVRRTQDSDDLRALLFNLPAPEAEGWKVWKPNLPVHYQVISLPFPNSNKPAAVGVIRIRQFDSEEIDEIEYVNECAALAEHMQNEAPLALLIDVRGNGGGHIPNGERLLQLFSPSPITPTTFQFLNTPLSRRLAFEDKSRFEGFGLEKDTGADYSTSSPITAPEDANDIGQRYYGRVALIADAHCYSTTDIFAAGFQDHRIGPVIGVDPTTGGGGANVFSYNEQEIAGLTTEDGFRFPQMPGGTDLEISVRRCLRAGRFQGEILEDFGVAADFVYRIREADLFNVDRGLYEFAFEKVIETSELRAVAIDLAVAEAQSDFPSQFQAELSIGCRFEGIDWAEIVVNGKVVQLFQDLRASGSSRLTMMAPSRGEESISRVDVRAYRFSRYDGTPFFPPLELKQVDGRTKFAYRLIASRTITDGDAKWLKDSPEAAMTIPPIRYPAEGEKRRRILFVVEGANRRALYEAVAIMRHLSATLEDVEVRYVTCRMGAAELVRFGAAAESIVEMNTTRWPSLSAIPSAFTDVWNRVADFQPLLIVAHDAFEFASFDCRLPAPCLFIASAKSFTNYSAAFPEFATGTLVLDDHDRDFPRARFAGRPCRELRYWHPALSAGKFVGEHDTKRIEIRERARKDAKLAQRELIVAVFSAPWGLNENEMPIFHLINSAFSRLEPRKHRQPGLDAKGELVFRRYSGKRLLWDRDAGTRSGQRFDASDFDRMMAACDLAICKEDPALIHELEAMGTPTIVISRSWTDGQYFTRNDLNTELTLGSLGPTELERFLDQRLEDAERGDSRPGVQPGQGIQSAALRVGTRLRNIENFRETILGNARRAADRILTAGDLQRFLQTHLRFTDEPKDLIEAVQSVLIRAANAAREPDAPRDQSGFLSQEACAELEAVIARFS